ncbi:DUF4388 domain-containing protein [Deferribacterales bacterium Es71-Z0220]|jgi:hypothetical protein|uniref:DUF4388 domain-containing protein n=1 Tax=Deferrivibrio essentukiensis TaxID=2880922 RepID=UPI001F61D181|nr:DUF4388 domain-containing protein [Deferrivibrio essentukiensis]MBZ4672063.1 hypothetical protein [Deferribacteraceae bacterium]MCB4205062.1 DUF4388 domain-containing protein [Deferrivibrio essentukiensis]
MAFKGNIKEFSLLDVIQLICQSSKTGILEVESEDFAAKVFIREGKLVDIKANTNNFDFKIGNYLVSRGAITEGDLQIYLEKQKKMPIRLGQILIEEGILTKEQLKQIHTDHLKSNFEKILAIEKGRYEFVPTVVEYNDSDITPISIDSILLDALKNIDEVKLFKKKISSLNLIYKKINNDSKYTVDNKITSKDNPIIVKNGRILFNTDAQIVFNNIDGHNTIQKIMSKSALDEVYVLKIIYLLLENNLIEHSTAEPIKTKTKISSVLNVIYGIIIFATLIFVTTLISKKLAVTDIVFNETYIKNKKEHIEQYNLELKNISQIYTKNQNNFKKLKLYTAEKGIFSD